MVELQYILSFTISQSAKTYAVYKCHNYNDLQSSSPDSYQLWDLLSKETESTEYEIELSDFVNHAAEKETQFYPNKVSDFN